MPIPLPVVNVLDAIAIPTPCSASWDEMAGNDRTRFCGQCRQPVHDVSELTTDEALALLGAEKPPCLRIYRRADGRVMTADCATRRERVWKWLGRRSGWAAAVFAALFLSGCRTATQGAMPGPYTEAVKTPPETSEQPKPPTP
jgi:hypothetical protein